MPYYVFLQVKRDLKSIRESMACGLPILYQNCGSYFINSIDHGTVLDNISIENISNCLSFYYKKLGYNI